MEATYMASEPIRDPKTDDLLTPQNSALVIIDYQPLQVNSIASMDRNLLVNHIVAVAKRRHSQALRMLAESSRLRSHDWAIFAWCEHRGLGLNDLEPVALSL
jgi:hypothetical protein